MAVGDVSSSSFEFYEGLRALIPGVAAVGTFAGTAATFGFPGGGLATDPLAALAAALVAGMVLLFLDVPSRAAVFYYDSPGGLIGSWRDVTPAHGARYLNVYYEVLDTVIPSGLRTRTYYQGVMYRIGFEGIYFASFAIPVLLVGITFPRVGLDRAHEAAVIRNIFLGGAAFQAVAMAGALVARLQEHRRKKRTPRSALIADLRIEVPWPDLMLLLVSAILVTWFAFGGPAGVGATGLSVPFLVWAYRYYNGVDAKRAPKEEDKPWNDWLRRRNLHAVTATALFGYAAGLVCVAGAARVPTGSPFDAVATAGWVSLMAVAALLISGRGHERKLQGSYAMQLIWWTRNKDKLVLSGFFTRRSP